ncbi:hypothetical protein [Streptomyces sp. NPDC017991]
MTSTRTTTHDVTDRVARVLCAGTAENRGVKGIRRAPGVYELIWVLTPR